MCETLGVKWISYDEFMEENPKVNIKIETFSWNDFYTKWTTGLASGNVPDMSTAQVGQVAEMINADALIPLNDLIDEIGRDKFNVLHKLFSFRPVKRFRRLAGTTCVCVYLLITLCEPAKT